jgi:DNA-binding transcriptional regulator YiaG
MNSSSQSPDLPARQTARTRKPLPAGLAAATALRAARLSAGLSQDELAEAQHTSVDAIRSWEDGTTQLASLPIADIDLLKETLSAAGADQQLVADIDAGAWCDVVLTTLAGGEDASCLLADPLASEPGFSDLLGWVISGQIPARYSSFEKTAIFPSECPEPGTRES